MRCRRLSTNSPKNPSMSPRTNQPIVIGYTSFSINARVSHSAVSRFRTPGSPGASPGRGTGSAQHSLGAKPWRKQILSERISAITLLIPPPRRLFCRYITLRQQGTGRTFLSQGISMPQAGWISKSSNQQNRQKRGKKAQI